MISKPIFIFFAVSTLFLDSFYFKLPSLNLKESNQFSINLYLKIFSVAFTVMILSFQTNRPWQTVQTQIRLLLEEQSDQGLHCLLLLRYKEQLDMAVLPALKSA